MSRNADMERGIAQVLYNFGQGNVFDYGKYDVAMMVSDWRVKDFEDLDANRVAGDIRSRARHFQNGGSSPWDDLTGADLEAFRPWKVEGELFPLTMVCENPNCLRADMRQRPTDFLATDHEGQMPGTCVACGGKLQQLPFVLPHECGEIYPARPTEECPEHGYDRPVLHKLSNDPSTWSFRCECNESMGYLGAYCDRCGEYLGGPTPPGGGGIFYPQSLIQVDIPTVGVEREELEQGEPWARVLIAAYLDDAKLGRNNTLEQIATREGEQEELEQLRDEGYGETEIQLYLEMQASRGRDTSHLNRQSMTEITREKVQPIGTGDTDVAERVYSTIANQLFTFHRATNGYEGNRSDVDDARHPEPTPLSRLLDDEEFVEMYPRAERYREKLDKIHVTETWVVDNFPLLNVLYGYSRASPDASQTQLRKFQHPYGDRSKLPVFADRSPSEAIILEINRKAIVNWLVENNVVSRAEVPDEDAPDSEYKSWFLNNVDVLSTENPFTPIEDQVTRRIYTLLHSMSHALVSTGSDQCGLQTDSISELVMPIVPAIVLYAKSTEHFALGGMFTLFKTRIHPWVDHAIEFADQCLFDPACMDDDEGAACHACLHLNPVSCESLNKHLNRELLVGGRSSTPFWDV